MAYRQGIASRLDLRQYRFVTRLLYAFHERQFVTREEVNKDVIVLFARTLADEYFDSDAPLQEEVGWLLNILLIKCFLSANYFEIW